MRRRIGRLALAAAVSALAGVPAAATERPPIVGVAHIAFHVSDLAKARAFYGGLLGYEEVWAAAGTPDSVFPIRPQELAAASGGTVADFRAR